MVIVGNWSKITVRGRSSCVLPTVIKRGTLMVTCYLCQRADKGNHHLETMSSLVEKDDEKNTFDSQIEACSKV